VWIEAKKQNNFGSEKGGSIESPFLRLSLRRVCRRRAPVAFLVPSLHLLEVWILAVAAFTPPEVSRHLRNSAIT
jgi:hypothetical protein